MFACLIDETYMKKKSMNVNEKIVEYGCVWSALLHLKYMLQASSTWRESIIFDQIFKKGPLFREPKYRVYPESNPFKIQIKKKQVDLDRSFKQVNWDIDHGLIDKWLGKSELIFQEKLSEKGWDFIWKNFKRMLI